MKRIPVMPPKLSLIKKRKRKPDAGRKSNPYDHSQKIFFILYYLRHYPTFDALSASFGMSTACACHWVNFLLEVVDVSSSISTPIEHIIGHLKALYILHTEFRSDVKKAEQAFRIGCKLYNFRLRNQ